MPLDWLDEPLLTALLPLPVTAAAALIDLRRRIIPDGLNLALLGLGLGLAALRGPALPGLASSLAQAACAALLLWGLRALYAKLRGRTGLGLGDVKFVGAATAWIGLVGLPFLVLVASMTALAALAPAALTGRRVAADFRLPFGPFLAIGFHAALLAGHSAT